MRCGEGMDGVVWEVEGVDGFRDKASDSALVKKDYHILFPY